MKSPSSTLTVGTVSTSVLVALAVWAIRVSVRATMEPERVKKNLCDNCDHSEGMHGDRIFGICSQHQYPNMCKCPGFVLWVAGKRRAA
jgi:hypothetical protein